MANTPPSLLIGREQPQKARKPQRPTPQKVFESGPWLPPTWKKADAAAIQAVARGQADAIEQKRALDWIIRQASGTYDASYRPGLEGARDTDFAEGRRHVGLNILKLLMVNLALLPNEDPRADEPEPKS